MSICTLKQFKKLFTLKNIKQNLKDLAVEGALTGDSL